jgi:hypothetical protein
MKSGRFVLVSGGTNYVTSFDTFEEAAVAWDDNGFIPAGLQLEDTETGRIWSHGARHVWEDAAT